MAVLTGTATDHDDLLDDLITFLTGLTSPESWTQLTSNITPPAGERHVYLRGPGLSGTDEIYINIRRYTNTVVNNSNNWEIRGALGFNADLDFDQQPGVSPAQYAILGSTTVPGISYRMVANGRRFIIKPTLDQNNLEMPIYCGLILPYATAAHHRYPLYIGANALDEGQSANPTSTERLRGFHDPFNDWDNVAGTASFLHFDNSWVRVGNTRFVNSSRLNTTETDEGTRTWPWDINYNIRNYTDGSYSLIPGTFYTDVGGGNVYGDFDGVFWVSGTGNSATAVITIDSTDYAVTNNPVDLGINDYAAIRLT